MLLASSRHVWFSGNVAAADTHALDHVGGGEASEAARSAEDEEHAVNEEEMQRNTRHSGTF